MINADGMIHLRCANSVSDTLRKLQELLTQRGIFVACHVSHSDAAAKAGLSMPSTELLVFGNAKAGTPLMLASPTLALDLPLKALVWQDAEGAVWLSYNDIGYLRDRHHVAVDMIALTAPEVIFRQAAGEP